jgi:hypothetical protein
MLDYTLCPLTCCKRSSGMRVMKISFTVTLSDCWIARFVDLFPFSPSNMTQSAAG